MRPRGFGTVELVTGVVVLGLLLAAGLAIKSAIDMARADGHGAGRKEALLEVAQRDNKDLAAAIAKVRQLEAEQAAREEAHRQAVAAIDVKREKEVTGVRAERDRIAAELRRLHLAGGTAHAGGAAGACAGPGRAAGAAGGRDAAAPGGPDGALVADEDEDLVTLGLLAEGDEAITDLTACQAIVVDDRRRRP